MITGTKPTEVQEKIFDLSLVLYSEHEMPNSTFTSRVIASTQSDLYGALNWCRCFFERKFTWRGQ